MYIKRIYIVLSVIISLLSAPLSMFAQKASNADYYEKDKKIYITYSLNKEADITLTVSIDDGPFQRISNTYLSGDVGVNVKAGSKKQIVWDVLKDREYLVGAVKFQVIAGESLNSFLRKSKLKKSSSFSRKTSAYSYTCNNFYETAGKLSVSFIEVGIGATLKSGFGFPLCFSAFTFRYKMLEVAPAYFTYDVMNIINGTHAAFYWSPQARAVIPITSEVAFIPSIGPSVDMFTKDWWFLLKANIRYYEPLLEGSYVDFFLGYENKGFTVGLSISYSLPISK